MGEAATPILASKVPKRNPGQTHLRSAPTCPNNPPLLLVLNFPALRCSWRLPRPIRGSRSSKWILEALPSAIYWPGSCKFRHAHCTSVRVQHWWASVSPFFADRAAQGEGDGRSTERQGIDRCSCRAAVSHLHTSCHWKEVECSGLLWDVGNRRLLNKCDGPTHRDCRPLECILLSRGSSCWQTAVATGGWWAHQ